MQFNFQKLLLYKDEQIFRIIKLNRTKTSGFISQVNIHANYSNQPISQNNFLSY